MAKAAKSRLSVEDVREIENQIAVNPMAYPLMAGTGGLRKMRFAPESMSTGKSGGIRVCYFIIDVAAHVWLVTMFAKNEKDNLSKADQRAMAKVIAGLKAPFKSK